MLSIRRLHLRIRRRSGSTHESIAAALSVRHLGAHLRRASHQANGPAPVTAIAWQGRRLRPAFEPNSVALSPVRLLTTGPSGMDRKNIVCRDFCSGISRNGASGLILISVPVLRQLTLPTCCYVPSSVVTKV
jgi:hypothetical protein